VDEKKLPLRERAYAVATGGTYDYVKSDYVREGELWRVELHSFENKTGARGTARAYIETRGWDHWVWEQTSPSEDTLYWSEEAVYIRSGERLCIRQATCTSGDELELLITGYVIYGSGGQIP